MTKKHFEAIALVVSRIGNTAIRLDLAADLAELFAGWNPRFDMHRFLDACKPGSEKP